MREDKTKKKCHQNQEWSAILNGLRLNAHITKWVPIQAPCDGIRRRRVACSVPACPVGKTTAPAGMAQSGVEGAHSPPPAPSTPSTRIKILRTPPYSQKKERKKKCRSSAKPAKSRKIEHGGRRSSGIRGGDHSHRYLKPHENTFMDEPFVPSRARSLLHSY